MCEHYSQAPGTHPKECCVKRWGKTARGATLKYGSEWYCHSILKFF
jgi:hypothetical protein